MSRAALFVVLVSLVGCSPRGGGGDDDHATYSAAGSIQKGPFDIGATVDLQELDSGLDPTGNTFGATTSDNFGSFAIPNNVGSPLVQVIATGFYFDEIVGEASSAQLTLRAYANLTNDSVVNVNVLTDLASRRIANLVGNGSSFSAAENQARGEVCAVFGLTSGAEIAFDNMDISESGDANAFLLASSAILLEMAHQQGPSAVVAELSARLATIGTDLASDGVLTDSSMAADLVAASMGLNLIALSEVRQNLEAHYGMGVVIPPFEDFVDSDGDGVLNRYDPPDYPLPLAGDYDLDINQFPNNSCWPSPDGDSFMSLLLATTLPIGISTSGSSFDLAWPELLADVFTDMHFVPGDAAGEIIGTGIPGVIVLSTACSLAKSGVGTGQILGTSSFESSMTLTLSAAILNTMGSMSDCSMFVGESIPGTNDFVPFPTLTPSNGDCSTTLMGSAAAAQ